MSRMLASVNSLQEALLVQSLNVDIIDLKQPAQGALGALPYETVAAIVDHLKPDAQLSATIGDLPMHGETVCRAVTRMAATGVDYVKIGFFPDGDWLDCINGLSAIAGRGHALIAVLFADCQPDLSVIQTLAQAGFHGVMLDTRQKGQGGLTHWLTIDELQNFVQSAKANGLLCGLAGSLSISDIPGLLPLNADYLGFRGALCRESLRTAQLDTAAIAEIKGILVNSRQISDNCRILDIV